VVDEDPWYAPLLPPPAQVIPRTGKPLWEFRQEHVTWSAVLRFHGESYGWETMILRDGELKIAQRFVLRAESPLCCHAPIPRSPESA